MTFVPRKGRCYSRANHIGLAIRAFLRLEHHFFTTGISWYEVKTRMIRDAVRNYLAEPLYELSLIA
jgi:putative transposase